MTTYKHSDPVVVVGENDFRSQNGERETFPLGGHAKNGLTKHELPSLSSERGKKAKPVNCRSTRQYPCISIHPPTGISLTNQNYQLVYLVGVCESIDELN